MFLRLTSAFGLVVMIACAWLLSRDRKHFPWRTVLWGMGLQFAFAIFILKTPIGLQLFSGAQVVMDQLNTYAYEGTKMVFGPLGDAETLRRTFGAGGAYVFAISVTATTHSYLIAFVVVLSLGRFAKGRRGHGLGDDENDADQRERKSGRREQYFPRTN